jgi:polyisoprenoid-binding protein YceI
MKQLVMFFAAAVTLTAVFSCNQKPTENTAGDVAAAMGNKFVAATDGSSVTWAGSKPTGTHNGNLNLVSGELFIKDDSLKAGSFVLDMTSINVTDLTGDEKGYLEAHLKGTAEDGQGVEDFFNTKQYPTGKFEITSATPSTEAGANYIVKGNLTLKDVTKEVSFPANVTVSGSEVTVSTAPFTINRTEWGITYQSKNVFKNLGDKFIDDNITIGIQLRAVAEAPAAAPAE